jgi:hypothetical protein
LKNEGLVKSRKRDFFTLSQNMRRVRRFSGPGNSPPELPPVQRFSKDEIKQGFSAGPEAVMIQYHNH